MYVGSFKLKVQKEDSGFLEKTNKTFAIGLMKMDSANGRFGFAIHICVCE
jgi:hypothetical protein